MRCSARSSINQVDTLMKISINGKQFDTQHTLLSLVIEEFGATPPYAIAINGEFVPQSRYQDTELATADLVDIVSPIFGG